MKSLSKEELNSLKEHVDDMLDFVRGLKNEEPPYFYRFLECMKYNLEIFDLIHYEGWEEMEQILKRDWIKANHGLIGIPGFRINGQSSGEKAVLDGRFIELVAGIERYLQTEQKQFR